LLNVSAVSTYKWVSQTAESLPDPEVREEIQEMELDELWHFIQATRASVGFGKLMVVANGFVSPGWWVAVIMLPLADSGKSPLVSNASPAPMTGLFTPTYQGGFHVGNNG
jgi:hypothetical protein